MYLLIIQFELFSTKNVSNSFYIDLIENIIDNLKIAQVRQSVSYYKNITDQDK